MSFRDSGNRTKLFINSRFVTNKVSKSETDGVDVVHKWFESIVFTIIGSCFCTARYATELSLLLVVSHIFIVLRSSTQISFLHYVSRYAVSTLEQKLSVLLKIRHLVLDLTSN